MTYHKEDSSVLMSEFFCMSQRGLVTLICFQCVTNDTTWFILCKFRGSRPIENLSRLHLQLRGGQVCTPLSP